MNKPCLKKECRECPFKRTSVAGWLGAASMDDDPATSFLDPHWVHEMPLPCHMQVNWEKGDVSEQVVSKPLCYGYLTMMKNSAKLPRDPYLAEQVQMMEPNITDYFANPLEFKNHHNKGNIQ